LIKQKLMETMRQRNRTYKLKGEVQLDDAYLGGEKPGKRGRGAANKIPFVIAVKTRKDKPVYTQLRRVSDFTGQEIKTYAAQNVEPGARVASDGLACFTAVTEAGVKHRPVMTGGGRPAVSEFKWVNTGLGNIKSAGTCRSCRPQRYLAAYEYRFNRRFELDKMVERLAAVAAKTAPQPRQTFRSAGMSG
jgi:hypothetical protein